MSDEILALPAPEQPKLLPAPQPEQPSADDRARARRRRRKVIAIAALVIVVLILIGWFLHHRQATKAKQANDEAQDRIPTVMTTTVQTSSSTAELRLPGSVRALTEASLFARSSGYLRARYVDIGDTVRRGDVLADVDSPDLDQQVVAGQAAVAQARQQLAQSRTSVNDAKARVVLAQVSYDRLLVLIRDAAVAQQQVDQAKQDLDTAKAAVASAEANVGAASENVKASQANGQRLSILQGYEKIRAPFDGIVTARNIDVGALVNASGGVDAVSGSATGGANGSSSSGTSSGSTSSTTSGSGGAQSMSSGSTTELFRIAEAGRVRVFVNVPQENAALVATDSPAEVAIEGFSRPFQGRVTRNSKSLDPMARTLLTEVQVPNEEGSLVPGMYAQVSFRSPRRGLPMLVPGEAVVARAKGLHVAVVEALRPEDRDRLAKRESSGDGKQPGPDRVRRIRLQTVEVGRDYGTQIEVTRGLEAGTEIVSNPGDQVEEGAFVVPQMQKGRGASPAGQESAGPASGNQSPSQAAPTKGRK